MVNSSIIAASERVLAAIVIRVDLAHVLDVSKFDRLLENILKFFSLPQNYSGIISARTEASSFYHRPISCYTQTTAPRKR